MKKYSQEEQTEILRKLNAGVIGKRKDWVWDNISKKTIYSYKKCKAIASQYKTREEFYTNDNPCYIVSKNKGWYDEITSHMPKGNNQGKGITKVTFKYIKRLAKKYKTRTELADNETRHIYITAKNNGWLDKIYGKIESKFTFEYVSNIAKDCKTRSEFNRKMSHAGLKIVRENNWMDILFPKKSK